MVEASFKTGSNKDKDSVAAYQDTIAKYGVYAGMDNHLDHKIRMENQMKGILLEMEEEKKKGLSSRKQQLLTWVETVENAVRQVSTWAYGGDSEKIFRAYLAGWNEIRNIALSIIFSDCDDEDAFHLDMDLLSWGDAIIQLSNNEKSVTPAKAFVIQTPAPQHSSVKIDSTSEEETK